MNIFYDGGKKSLEFSLSIPALVAGQAGAGKTTLLKKIIPALAKERKVCILNPCHQKEYNSLAEKTVPVYMWLADGKYRLPSDAGTYLFDFDRTPETANNIREVLTRLSNVYRKEKVAFVLDTCCADTPEAYEELFKFFLSLQSENVMCIVTVQSLADLNLENTDVQVFLTGERVKRCNGKE